MTTTTHTQEALPELRQLGFSLYEAKAYLALLTTPPVNGYDLAKLSGIPTSKVYEILRRLVAKGAALVSAGEPTLYRAVPPEQLIDGIRRQTKRSLDSLARTLPTFSMSTKVGLVWRLNDQQTILRHMVEIVGTAAREVFLSIWPSETLPLVEPVDSFRRRGGRVWAASFGPSPLKGEGVYDLFSCGASSSARLGRRLAVVVGDDDRVLIAEFRDDADPTGTFAKDPPLALVAKEYIIHDLVNHALILELGHDRFAELRNRHPLIGGLLGPAGPPSDIP